MHVHRLHLFPFECSILRACVHRLYLSPFQHWILSVHRLHLSLFQRLILSVHRLHLSPFQRWILKPQSVIWIMHSSSLVLQTLIDLHKVDPMVVGDPFSLFSVGGW